MANIIIITRRNLYTGYNIFNIIIKGYKPLSTFIYINSHIISPYFFNYKIRVTALFIKT